MPAELADQPRIGRRHAVQRIADMQAGNGPGRALDLAVASIGKGDHRAVVALLQARGENADHSLMPLRIEQAETEGQLAFLQAGTVEHLRSEEHTSELQS